MHSCSNRQTKRMEWASQKKNNRFDSIRKYAGDAIYFPQQKYNNMKYSFDRYPYAIQNRYLLGLWGKISKAYPNGSRGKNKQKRKIETIKKWKENYLFSVAKMGKERERETKLRVTVYYGLRALETINWCAVYTFFSYKVCTSNIFVSGMCEFCPSGRWWCVGDTTIMPCQQQAFFSPPQSISHELKKKTRNEKGYKVG